MRQRIGLLGGTFDPPHVGHLWLAETAVAQLSLNAVWFLPVGQPVHKDAQQITAVAHRIAMSHLAIAHNPRFVLDETDARRPPPHTTLTLIQQLQTEHPHADFWLLLGSDSLFDLPKWHKPQQLIQNCRLAVLERTAVAPNWPALETAVPGVRNHIDWLSGPTLSISSTAVRAWARQGHSLRYVVETAVADYIVRQELYAGTGG